MDDKMIQRLDAHARKVGEKLGVHANVSLNAGDESDANPGEPRVVLTVFHDAAEAQCRDFRPDARDLKARIEQEISLLTQALGQH